MTNAIRLGNELQCIITGYKGIATAKVEYLNGEIEYSVTPTIAKDSIYPKAEWVSATRLIKIGDGITVPNVKHELGFSYPNGKK